MKKIIILICLINIFSSCSSTSKHQIVMDDNFLDDDELRHIENQDFEPPKIIPFVEHQDFYDGKFNKADSLAAESAARLDASQLKTLERGDEALTQIISLCYQNKFDNAMKMADKNYETHKTHSNYWNQIASCYFLQKNYRKALLYYNRSRELSEKYAPPVNNLGVIQEVQGYAQEALLTYKHAYDLNAFSATPAFNLGQMYLKYGLIDEAMNIFNALRNKNQNDPEVNVALANIYLFKGDVGRAITLFSSLDKKLYKEAIYGLNYSVALKMAGRASDAKSVFKNINTNKISNIEAYYQRVKAYVAD